MVETLKVKDDERLYKYKPIDLMMLECLTLPQIDLPLVNIFTPGMYARERHVPGESVVISAIHKTSHPFVISKGTVSVSEDGIDWVHLQAPYTGITKRGTQRIIVFHTDTVWTTFHVNKGDSMDVSRIEKRLVSMPKIPKELLKQADVKYLTII